MPVTLNKIHNLNKPRMGVDTLARVETRRGFYHFMLIEITKTLRLQAEHIESVIEVQNGPSDDPRVVVTMQSGDTIDLPGWTMERWDKQIATIITQMNLLQRR